MKHLLLTISLFLCSVYLSGQATISMNTPPTSGGTRTACQQISLKPGFSFKATATSGLTLIVNPSTCDPYGGSTSSASTSQNYIRTMTYTTDNGSRYLEAIQYFDGLGRPVQTVQRAVTPNTADLVTYQEYDAFGRESNSWLPVAIASNNGAFADLTKVKANITKTYPNETAPYSKPVYEASPLNRILEQYGPGAAWHTNKKAVKTEYLTNGTDAVDNGALSCRKYIVTGFGLTTKLTYTAGATYDTGQLYVTRMTDEDGNKVYEFKDKLGQVLLTRAINNLNGTIQHLNTLYVYDDFGNLSYVIPPEGFDKIKDYSDNNTEMKRYAYLYKYDNRNRCIWKRLPGCEPVYYVYDKADRLIFSQDGEQRLKKQWAFTIPDAFGRTVLTGTCKNALDYAADPLKAAVVKAVWAGGTTTTKGYTVSGVTLSTPTILSASYYDNYSFMNTNGIPAITDANIKPEAIAGYGTQYTGGYKGMLTGTLTAQMNADGTVSSSDLYSVMYYDSRGRLIQTKSNNHLSGGIEKEYIAYNFTGQPVKKLHIHSATGKSTQTELYAYTYDHAGRMVKETHQLNGGSTVILAQNTYDELGRLQTNQKHTHANLKTTYGYNVRSWTKTISSPLFGQTLFYNDSYGGSKAQYNGNISAMAWKFSDEPSTQGYAFVYDNMSRLTAANFLINAINNVHYKTAYDYDKQGNMKTLQRYGRLQDMSIGLVDNLTMTYTGNQLTKAEDAVPTINLAASMDFKNYSNAAVEYTYNANGAMTKDLNKGITGIQYNSLNLPQQMDIKSPVAEARNEYTYSVSGQKLKVVQKWNPNYSTTPVIGSTVNTAALTQTKTTDYVGNKVYENGIIKRILVDGGYIEGNTYHFYQSDHLGNNRVVANSGGIQVQKTHYYPFGSSFAVASGTSTQPYKYNGKELDPMHQLNLYDYSARYYESSIGRFTSVDPHAEKYYNISPYVYAANNPIRIIDPLGTDTIHVNPNGTAQTYPDGSMISHPGGDGNVFIQDQPLSEVVYEAPRIYRTPDYVGYSFSGTAVFGIGTSINISIGVMKNDGIFIQPSLAFGSGLDISTSFTTQTGYYKGPLKPTATSLEGTSESINASVLYLTGGEARDQVKVIKEMERRTPNGRITVSNPVFVNGNNWKITSYGVTVGPTPVGYTNMTSYTPTTLYLYKK